jgi:hypothetical protein
MAKVFDITNWNELPWLNTGGTRNKKIYLNPEDNELYYFKQSLKKEKKDYKYEFWSEVIAYEIGLLCGFDVLPYQIAVRGSEVGCISKSMINSAKEELVEGGRYIQAFDSTFNPDDRKLRHQYNFGLIAATLQYFQLSDSFKHLVEVIVFDALIGNSDRHQENWAFITEHSALSKSLSEMERDLERGNFEMSYKWLKKVIDSIYLVKGTRKVKPEYKRIKLLMPSHTRFAPIYDNGCSFGRELSEERVRELLTNTPSLEKYLEKGESEIHWETKKVSHFVLLKYLLKEEDIAKHVESTIKRVSALFDESKVRELINKVDVQLPEACEYIKIPEERKQLICKLVISRFNSLKALV